MEKKSWKSPQALLVISIIIIIFTYIFLDIFIIKPQIRKDLMAVKQQYIEVSSFVHKKMPEIDSTFNTLKTQTKETKDKVEIITKSLVQK